MIQPRSIVKIADNSGGKVGRIFKVLARPKKHYAELGEVVVLSVQKAEPRKAVKKKDVLHAVVVRQVKATRRKDGSYIRFRRERGRHHRERQEGTYRRTHIRAHPSRGRRSGL